MRTLIDVSYYQNFSTTQYDLLATGVDGIIVRTGHDLVLDTMARYHLMEARARNIPVSSYWWCDPTDDPVRQATIIADTTKKALLPSVWLDFEQYWTDWSAYMRGDYDTAYNTRFSAEQLESFYRKIYYNVKSELFGTGIEVGIYSADWFIDRYAPRLREWVFECNYWEARYLRWSSPTELKAMNTKLGIPFTIDKVKEFMLIAPVLRGINRQFESLMYVQGLPKNLDWNFITNAGYTTMFGIDAPPDVIVIPPVSTLKTYVINPYALWARLGPGVGYPKTGYYLKGARVSVFENSGDWGKTEKGWINLTYTTPIQGSYKVTAWVLTVRDIPSAGGTPVAYLKMGDIVIETNRMANWINIGKGWVNSDYLKPV